MNNMNMNDAKRYMNEAAHTLKHWACVVAESATRNKKVWMIGAGMN